MHRIPRIAISAALLAAAAAGCQKQAPAGSAGAPAAGTSAASPTGMAAIDSAKSKAAAASAASRRAAAAIRVWVCPMHPDYTSDHPGTCPRCGMDLVEKS
ncbi:MAG TPA: heavy metal-binding domain-containing protein [Candidatus Saccharimonadales bacterium]|nr:heavy metal-binding domain-containing protein [Candidatus Saccharimonadales bacterium]